MLAAIGHTPVVRLQKIVPSGAADVLVKLEYYNPTGSYKDRMALSMIERAEQRGTLKPGMTVVEYTGGSTGISLAFVCAVKGYRCRIVTNDAVALEKRRSMEIFGAELEVLKSQGEKLSADLVPKMMERAREIATEGPSYATDQMRNPDMVAGYASLGEELLRQGDGPIHTFCAAGGTSGMLVGGGGGRADPSLWRGGRNFWHADGDGAGAVREAASTPDRGLRARDVVGVDRWQGGNARRGRRRAGVRATAIRLSDSQRVARHQRGRGTPAGVGARSARGDLRRHEHRAQRRGSDSDRQGDRRRAYRRHGGSGQRVQVFGRGPVRETALTAGIDR